MSDSNTTDDDTMVRVTVRLTDPMLAAIDQLVEIGEHPTRSECVRAGIRREFRDAGVERGDRRPGRSGETLIGDGGWEPEPAELRDGETRDEDSHARQLTEAQRELVEGDDDESDEEGGE
jgi:Arc/MetJ-type ribon-helix-helix transcriptional regulator